jgi:hypothetical protein
MSSPSKHHNATSASAADDDIHQPKRVVMKPEELEKTAERLYGHSVKKIQEQRKKFDEAVEFQASHNGTVKVRKSEPTDAEAKALERLYSQPIEKKKRNLEAAEKKQSALAPPTKKVLPEEVDQITDRLFAQAMKRKQTNLEASTKKLYGADADAKKLDADQLKARVDSLFTQAVEKKKAAVTKLTDQYQWKVESKKISKEEASALGERLAKKA